MNAGTALVAAYFKAQTTFDFGGRFNIAPRQDVPVVTNRKDTREIVGMNWGFLPSWTKDAAHGVRPINAKSESVQTNGMFRGSFQKRRCLVPATGFYEWQVIDAKHKQPYLITLNARNIYAIAGLYDNYRGKDEKWHQTFTIVTTAPNDLVANVHDRMPVILSREDEELWLDQAAGADDLSTLLTAYPESGMRATAIPTRVNSVANEGPDVAEPGGAGA